MVLHDDPELPAGPLTLFFFIHPPGDQHAYRVTVDDGR